MILDDLYMNGFNLWLKLVGNVEIYNLEVDLRIINVVGVVVF